MFSLTRVYRSYALMIVLHDHLVRGLILCVFVLAVTRSTSMTGEPSLGPHVTQFIPQGTVKHIR